MPLRLLLLCGLLPILFLCSAQLPGAEADGWALLAKRRADIELSTKGKVVDKMQIDFGDRQLASPWLAKRGFSPVAFTMDSGKGGGAWRFEVDAANKGDRLTMQVNLRTKQRNVLAGTMSVIAANGKVETYLISGKLAAADDPPPKR